MTFKLNIIHATYYFLPPYIAFKSIKKGAPNLSLKHLTSFQFFPMGIPSGISFYDPSNAAAPPTISEISLVIASCLALL